MLNKLFSEFTLVEKVSDDVIKRFIGKVPDNILEIWEKYGFGSILNGYLKIVNPDEFQPVLKEVYLRNEDAIVLFATSMGDIIVWEKNRYLNMLNFRKNIVHVISAGFDFFLDDLNDESFLDEELYWSPYSDAIKRYGEPDFDECFAYEPILGLGGTEKVENLSKVKLAEHIYLIKEIMGPIE